MGFVHLHEVADDPAQEAVQRVVAGQVADVSSVHRDRGVRPGLQAGEERRYLPLYCDTIEYVCDNRTDACTIQHETAAGYAVAAPCQPAGRRRAARPVNREPAARPPSPISVSRHRITPAMRSCRSECTGKPRCEARGRAPNDTEASRPVLIRTFRLVFGSCSQGHLTCALT